MRAAREGLSSVKTPWQEACSIADHLASIQRNDLPGKRKLVPNLPGNLRYLNMQRERPETSTT